MDALINIVLPVFGIILTGYLAGRFEALGPESAAALNRFVFYFALPCALFIFTARAPIDNFQLAFHRRLREWRAIDGSDRTHSWTALVSPS